MDPKELLKQYKERFDPVLAEYFARKKKQGGNSLNMEALDIVENFTMSGGKRIRPALFYYAYLAMGGSDETEIINASMSSELFHTFLLVHDDVIDRDSLRHGVETVHTTYKKKAELINSRIEPSHYGNSMAIGVGDLIDSMANEILCESKFSAEYVIRAFKKLQDILFVVVGGELLDVELEAKGTATEEEIMEMYKDKTAGYTYEGPIHMGAILAGADDDVLKQLSDYAIPVGIAFQIRDDILGVFADEEKLGKPVGSDVIEGKQTILVLKALEKGSEEEKSRLKELLGKRDITSEELEDFRNIIRNTGSLKYAEDKCEQLVEESLSALSKVPIKSEEAGEFFKGIARYMIERKY